MHVHGLQAESHCIYIEDFAKLGTLHGCGQLMQLCIEQHAQHCSQARNWVVAHLL